MIEIIFWVSVLLLGHSYLGYPGLMAIWAAMRPRPTPLQTLEPTVSVVVVAHNEARRIEGRIENLLSLDYPRGRLEIVVASDGSTDDTPERARAYESLGVTVIEFAPHRGKPAVLNDIVPKARGEIVALADTRQRFEASTLRALIAPFADPRVGAVSGNLILTEGPEGTAAGKGVKFYWDYEKSIRRSESLADSTVGVTGAVYAIRRELFDPIPEDTILDDVLIPMRTVRQGYRVLFAPEARAYDRVAGTAGEELTRKVRTIAGNFQLFAQHPWLLVPFRNRLWFQTVSHKVLRLLGPLLLAAVLTTNLLLLEQPLFRWSIGLQVGFYAAALAGHVLRSQKRKIPLFSIPYVFCLLNWITVVAFFRFIMGRQRVTWERASP